MCCCPIYLTATESNLDGIMSGRDESPPRGDYKGVLLKCTGKMMMMMMSGATAQTGPWPSLRVS
jgi:hypothetical protein